MMEIARLLGSETEWPTVEHLSTDWESEFIDLSRQRDEEQVDLADELREHDEEY